MLAFLKALLLIVGKYIAKKEKDITIQNALNSFI